MTTVDAAQAASELEAFKALETRSSHKRRSLRLRVVLIVVGVVVLVGGFFVVRGMLAPPPAKSAQATEEVTRGTYDETIDSTGNLAAFEQVTVTSEIEGTVAEVRVGRGETVKEGQVLFVVNNPELDRQVEAAQRTLNTARTSYNDAVIERDNAKTQANNAYQAWQNAKAASDGDDAAVLAQAQDAYQQAKSTVDTAQKAVNQTWASLEEAEAGLATAKGQAAKREITSPIDGQVVVSNVERGTKLSTLAAAGKPAMQIATMNKMKVTIPVNEADILKIEQGQAAEVSFDALKDYSAQATVSAIATTPSGGGGEGGGGSNSVVTYAVDLLIDKPDPRLKIGMSASAVIKLKTFENALLIPYAALSETEEGTAVTVRAADGSEQTVAVKVLASNERQAAVEGKLKVGDMVVLPPTNTDTKASSGAQTQTFGR